MRRIALALAAALLWPLVQAAPADACGGRERPVCTVLRPAAEVARMRDPVGWGQDCIVVVGGLGSPVDGSDAAYFGAALGDLANSVGHRLVRFGVDRGSYDTTGAISRSGAALGSVLRGLSVDCDAIHVLAHSMGGAVADRALSKLEPGSLGIATYVAMASPHNGATLARVVRAIAAVPESVGAGDLTSDALDDLASMRAPRRIPRLEHVRLRMTSDLFVLHRDNHDPRVDVRELDPASLGELEGHGGIVRDRRVQEIVRETIRSGRVPDRT